MCVTKNICKILICRNGGLKWCVCLVLGFQVVEYVCVCVWIGGLVTIWLCVPHASQLSLYLDSKNMINLTKKEEGIDQSLTPNSGLFVQWFTYRQLMAFAASRRLHSALSGNGIRLYSLSFS